MLMRPCDSCGRYFDVEPEKAPDPPEPSITNDDLVALMIAEMEGFIPAPIAMRVPVPPPPTGHRYAVALPSKSQYWFSISEEACGWAYAENRGYFSHRIGEPPRRPHAGQRTDRPPGIVKGAIPDDEG